MDGWMGVVLIQFGPARKNALFGTIIHFVTHREVIRRHHCAARPSSPNDIMIYYYDYGQHRHRENPPLCLFGKMLLSSSIIKSASASALRVQSSVKVAAIHHLLTNLAGTRPFVSDDGQTSVILARWKFIIGFLFGWYSWERRGGEERPLCVCDFCSFAFQMMDERTVDEKISKGWEISWETPSIRW